MKRFLSVISLVIFASVVVSTVSFAEEETRVGLSNKTGHLLHFYIDEKFMCDAPAYGWCVADHVTVGRHVLKVTSDGLRGPVLGTADVGPKGYLWIIGE